MKIEAKIQNIVLNTSKVLAYSSELFYRGAKLSCENQEKGMFIPKGLRISFTTYINGLSIEKWKKYTNIENVKLKLLIKGKCSVDKLSYRGRFRGIDRELLGTELITGETKSTFTIDYDNVSGDILTFEINAIEDTHIYEAYYYTEVDVDKKREVNLALGIATYKREEFLLSNLKLIEENIFNGNDEISNHLDVFISDNGNTIKEEQITSNRIHLFKNINAGGAGGFARCMMEVINANEKGKNITHLTLMDDDIHLLPETIKRTYYLLSIVKEEYADYFINGAMLRLTDLKFQHENLGAFDAVYGYRALRQFADISSLNSIITNEKVELLSKIDNKYAAWWYCTIPIKYVNKNNLPLPIFLRGDDVEYSIRNNAQFISINGIAVWHQAIKWEQKNELYYKERNFLVLLTVTERFKDADRLLFIRRTFKERLFMLDYKGAALVLDALEHYMKGPDFFINTNSAELLDNIKQKTETYEPVAPQIKPLYHNEGLFYNPMRTKIQKIIYRLTWNGLYIPSIFLKKDEPIIYFGNVYTPKRYFLRKRLIAIDPFNNTMAIRNMDKKIAKKLLERYKKLIKQYKKQKDSIFKEYQEKFEYMTSYDFWNKHMSVIESGDKYGKK